MDLLHWSSVGAIQLDKERLPPEGVSTRHGIVLPHCCCLTRYLVVT